jgi:anti-sigma factor RsiW
MREHTNAATVEMNEPVRLEHLTDAEISGYLDQDLAVEARTGVESHLDACDECRSAVAEVARLTE